MAEIKRPPDARATLYSINPPRIGALADEQVAHVTREVNRVLALLSTAISQLRDEILLLKAELKKQQTSK
jgi:uncharacterized small protein (DUF1192 family)